jgi:hypothetical protein
MASSPGSQIQGDAPNTTQINSLFQRCAPAIRSNIGECGTVTLCENLKPETVGDLEFIYQNDGEYRLLNHLLMTHFTIKACGTVQHGMRDFFMANLKTTRKNQIKFDQNERALTKVAPFIMANQRIPRNNISWQFTGGIAGGSGASWQGAVASPSGIPADVRSFPVGMVVFIISLGSGGQKTKTQWVIENSELSSDGTYVQVWLTDQNGGSLFPADSLVYPATGVLYRGVVNVGKTESYCDDEPGYIDTKRVPFWMQDTRWTMCNSQLFQEWQDLVLDNNPLYAAYEYLPEVERQRQMGESFETRLFNALWFQGAINNKQNLTEYDQLPELTNFLSDTGLGVEGGRCVGRQANAIGWLEQLRECDRWFDCQGATLNIYSIFDAIYSMRRVRAGVGSAAQMRFDVFTDGITAGLLEQGFIQFYDLKFGGKEQYVMNNVAQGENTELGLQFTSYRLDGRNAGVVLNVISDWAFDDTLSDFHAMGLDNAGRTIMFLDMTGIYMQVIESGKQTNHTGDLKDLVAVDASYRCVIETYSSDTLINWLKFTAVLECPAANLILDNFGDAVPIVAANTAPAGAHPNYIPTTLNASYGVTPYAV